MSIFSEMALPTENEGQGFSSNFSDTDECEGMSAEILGNSVADESDDESDQDAFDDLAKEVKKTVQCSPSPEQKRKEHEAQETKRKAEWETAQKAKQEKEQEEWEKVLAVGGDELLVNSAKRIEHETERLTRRNMKVCVSEHIQVKCAADPAFAKQVLHPRKNMVNCFRYINRLALAFVKQEMEDNGEDAAPGGFGGDVPDDLCYKWAEDYFGDMNADEDKSNDEKFVPKSYYGPSPSPNKKTTKQPEKKAEVPKKADKAASDGQLSFGEVLSIDCI